MSKYPDVLNKNMVGKYPASVNLGGGYVWDDVLEYRVWCSPENGASNLENGNDYYYAFSSYEEALKFSKKKNEGAEKPIVLILQKEYIDEPQPENYIHVKDRRIAEWQVEFLNRPRRTDKTIPDFLAPNAPENRLDILRGINKI